MKKAAPCRNRNAAKAQGKGWFHMSQRKSSKKPVASARTNRRGVTAEVKHVCPQADKKCLNPYCGRMCTYARGLCHNCYDLARRHVADKRTTWAAMEKAGKCLPAKHSVTDLGPRRAWFLTGGR